MTREDDNAELASAHAALKDFTAAVEGTLPKEFFGAFMVLYRKNGTTVGALYGSENFKKLFYPHEKLVRQLTKKITRAVFGSVQ